MSRQLAGSEVVQAQGALRKAGCKERWENLTFHSADMC